MLGDRIVVLSTHRQTRRQIARSLHSGGIDVVFVEDAAHLLASLAARLPNLVIFDCDNGDAASIEQALEHLRAIPDHPSVVLLSVGSDKGMLRDLLARHEMGNLVAKHGAIRAVFPVLDERELLVTCQKVMQRNIFGIDKYVGSWGIVLHRDVIRSVDDKVPFLARFEEYLVALDCPATIIPPIVTVAEELVLNAIVHAPHLDGKPRYEHIGPVQGLQLDPHEYVDVTYGCDGQRLMLSVQDRFGRLEKKTVYDYLARGFGNERLEAEEKASGAGLGLALAFRSIHQLIFNIHDGLRTEVIAGWYLRVSSASEFRQVAKSLNVFWLDASEVSSDRRPDEDTPRDAAPVPAEP